MTQMLRQARLLFAEVKQSQWLALAGSAIALLATYGTFLSMVFSPDPEVADRAIFTFQGISAFLPPLGATMWAYLCVGSVFERARDVLYAKNRHHLTKAVIRNVVLLLFLVFACSATTSFLAPQYSADIIGITLRIIASSVLCIGMIALASYVFSVAYLGLAASLMFVLFSYGAHLGWFSGPPFWLMSGEGVDLNNVLTLAVIALALQAALFVLETKRVRF